MHLLQVCNVGNIVGGTTACAWSVTRALPDFEHTVWFRSPPTEQTREAFSHCRIEQRRTLSPDLFRKIHADLVLLHNTPGASTKWTAQTLPEFPRMIGYLHSRQLEFAATHRRVVCSQSLSSQLEKAEASILHQGVPLPPRTTSRETRSLDPYLRVGRICTPTSRKWPEWLPEFYEHLARQHPGIQWEFVGCPENMQSPLQQSTGERCCFYPASWSARSLLHEWHVLLYSQPDVQETFGRVVAEAMRCGCVPVVDNAGGFGEQIGPDTGFLCANREEFCGALQELSRPGEWWQRSQRCRESADAQFSLTSFRKRLLHVFEEALL